MIDDLFDYIKLREFNPECIVVQCGVDGLSNDPFEEFLLSSFAFTGFFDRLLKSFDQNIPILILGGGGYNPPEAAKCWLLILAKILDIQLDRSIPYHEFLNYYGPSFSLDKQDEEYQILSKNVKIKDFLRLK